MNLQTRSDLVLIDFDMLSLPKKCTLRPLHQAIVHPKKTESPFSERNDSEETTFVVRRYVSTLFTGNPFISMLWCLALEVGRASVCLLKMIQISTVMRLHVSTVMRLPRNIWKMQLRWDLG